MDLGPDAITPSSVSPDAPATSTPVRSRSVAGRVGRLVPRAAAALLVAAVGLQPAVLAAQELTFGGQLRPRFETRDPGTPDGRAQAFTSLRTRLSVEAAVRPGITAFVQLQDVRLFGEETSTLGDFDADAFDVHQAWAELGTDADLVGLRVGRQEAAYGGERLVGAVNWTQQARSFDGARVRIGQAGARARLDAFAFQLAESASAVHEADAAFLGGYGTLDVGSDRSLELYALWNRAEAGDADTDQLTTGLRYVATTGAVEYRVEGALQTGERAGRDVDAWFVGLRAGADVAGGDGRITLWYDHLSGGDPSDDEVGSFSTLFATNHKFYGFADLFLDIPLHTAGRGLRDVAVKGAWFPAERWRVGLDLHHFRVAEDAGLESGHLANETDLTLSYDLGSGARLTGGFSWVAEGDALAPVRGIGEDVTFGYLMLDVPF